MIIGGRLQRNIAEDNDGVLGYENDKRDIASIWGDVGYTYTFVFSNGYFWNLWGAVGIAYATWSALGIALITLSGIFFFKQTPDLGAIIGLLLIISGVAVLNLFSKMKIH